MKILTSTTISVAGLLILGAAFANAAPSGPVPANTAPVAAPADATGTDKTDDEWVKKSLGPFILTAGPTSDDGFSSQITGSGRTKPTFRSSDKFAFSPYLEYSVNASWNTDPENQNQASVEIKPGVDSGIYTGKWDFNNAPDPAGPAPDCPIGADGIQNCGDAQAPKAPKPFFDLGFYGDLKYRYGTFQKNNAPVKVNQLLGGGGFYGVIRKGTENFYIWPRLSVTYFTPISTDTPVADTDLPKGVKADYIQAELKTGVNLGRPGGWWVKDPNTYPLRLIVTYNGSQPTTGQDKDWEDLWDLKLSATLPDKSFKPVITYQSGKNGGLTYDRQILFGILHELR